MTNCDLRNHEKGCADMFRRARGRVGHPCHECEIGKERTAGDVTNPPFPDTKPAIPETIPPKEEKALGKTNEERILSSVTNKGVVGRSKLIPILRLGSKELEAAALVLEKDGKIKIWRTQGGGAIYALPDRPDPRPGKAATSKASATPPHQEECQSGEAGVDAA